MEARNLNRTSFQHQFSTTVSKVSTELATISTLCHVTIGDDFRPLGSKKRNQKKMELFVPVKREQFFSFFSILDAVSKKGREW